MSLRSELNAAVPVAAPGEFRALALSPTVPIWPPVVLAPMAGVTNPPFRALCRRMGAGLYVAEMLHARGLSEGNARTLRLASFGPDETLRSIQIFGAEPQAMHDAARFLVNELGAQHVDVNMGCPVRKVTGRGGGSALPARPALMRAVLAAVVRGAGEVPVTTKIRLGLDDETLTWRDAVSAASDTGCRWIGVHARTAAQLYSGHARWDELARVKDFAATLPAPPGATGTGFPVLGNGDIWEAWDALRMLRSTGCDGVIIGRGCLGRPWLFRELAAVFEGRQPLDPPGLGEVLVILREHAGLLVDFFGERQGCRELRKWCAWYTKGFDGSSVVRDALARIETLAELDVLLAQLDPDQAFPLRALRLSRAKRGGSQDSVHLPHGWLEQAAREAAPESCTSDPPPLFLPDEPFPPYRFVPGQAPHPFAHSDGYAFGQRDIAPPFVPAAQWRQNRPWLRGVDFFNRGWWWEAHEVWEGLWHVAKGRDETQREFLKAMIQFAAAALNRERGLHAGSERLLASACAGLQRVRDALVADAQPSPRADAPAPTLMGLSLDELHVAARAALSTPVPRVEGFWLRPQ